RISILAGAGSSETGYVKADRPDQLAQAFLRTGRAIRFLNDRPRRATADHIAPLLNRTPCSARSQVCNAARVRSGWAVIWLARAASWIGVNLRGRWPRRELALTSPVRRRRIHAL